eukprot:747804-Hanusia_phi.AAC.1
MLGDREEARGCVRERERDHGGSEEELARLCSPSSKILLLMQPASRLPLPPLRRHDCSFIFSPSLCPLPSL